MTNLTGRYTKELETKTYRMINHANSSFPTLQYL